jgi:hypothetical protein
MKNANAHKTLQIGNVLPFAIAFSFIEGAFAVAAILALSIFFSDTDQRWTLLSMQYLLAILVFSSAIWVYGHLKKVTFTRSYFLGVSLVYVAFALLVGLSAFWTWGSFSV